jgi:thiamine-phosphate pyrophosphorylase
MSAHAEEAGTQIYLVSPDFTDVDAFAALLERALSAVDVGAFQLRLKNTSDDIIIAASLKLKEICHRYGVSFILNDRPDLAKEVGADGVHLGEEADLYPQARKLLGKQAIIGISCYGSVDRALKYAQDGADYVAFGAFYPTTTKEPKARPDPEILSWWVRNSVVPCVAIGGIDSSNAEVLVKAGADFVAVVRAAWDDEGAIEENMQKLARAVESV